MRRPTIITIAVATMLLLTCGLFFLRHFHSSVLSPGALASKPIGPPASWADDCSRLLRAVRDSGRHLAENKTTLSSDEASIYRIVLQSWQSKNGKTLNVSDKTIPMDVTSPMGISDCECLKEIDVKSIVTASHSFHRLRSNFLSGGKIRLVDANLQMRTVHENDPGNWTGKGNSAESAVNRAFDAGLFSLSEIAFDKQHRRALVTYSFVCGSLCGSGGAWLFENINGEWRRSEHLCGGWVS
jgi:hypothetical protein